MDRSTLVKGKFCRCPSKNYNATWYTDLYSGYQLHEDCDKLNYWEAIHHCCECGISFFPTFKIPYIDLAMCEYCCD